ncbi:MAG: DUF4145 domain-containing protein [Flavobacterium sp.]|uniref:DUF4145 domain-containing protein n=1 Tax=Flavobacterium sp. TaxID=239 RepID=UPI0012193427|nr:DUF4145 domain-containing protein [Flavobacterium sp.]RZJ66759.1 MAG: DUF4145 domain-containing protein [Flavobacterium sp.]
MEPKKIEKDSFCRKCKGATDQEVLHQTYEHLIEDDGYYENNYYQVIQCKGCKTISFRKVYNDVATLSHWDDGDEPFSLELFPNSSIHHLPITSFSHTPLNIRNIYKETIEAYNNNQLILASGGLRAIIEGICVDKKIEGIAIIDKAGAKKMVRCLQGKIEGLAQQGYLTKGNAEILHELRFIGNEALHELAAPPRLELKLAIKIVEHTIETLYELEYKGKSLKQNIAERKTKPKNP